MLNEKLKDLYLKHPGTFIERREDQILSSMVEVRYIESLNEYCIKYKYWFYSLFFEDFDLLLVAYHRIVNCGVLSPSSVVEGMKMTKFGTYYV